MKNLFYSCYKYLPRYYTPSKFNDKLYTFPNLFYWEKYIANIDSLEEIEFIDKELKKKWINLNKNSKKKHSVKNLQSLEKELKQKWASGISTQEVFNTIFKCKSDHFVNKAHIDLCKKENNYVIDKVDYIDYKNKYNL